VLGKARALFDGRNVQNSVQVHAHAAEHIVLVSHRSEALHLELADQDIAQSILVFALVHANFHFFLVRMAGIEAFGAGDGQRAVAPQDRFVAMRMRNAAANLFS
jgi:hypothetical protein